MNLAVNLTVKLARLHLGHLKMNTFAKKWYNGGRCWRCLKFVYCALENPSISLLCVEERESDVVGKLINISVGSLKELSAIPLWQHQQASGTFFNSCEDMCGHVRTCDGTWGHVRTGGDMWGEWEGWELFCHSQPDCYICSPLHLTQNVTGNKNVLHFENIALDHCHCHCPMAREIFNVKIV